MFNFKLLKVLALAALPPVLMCACGTRGALAPQDVPSPTSASAPTISYTVTPAPAASGSSPSTSATNVVASGSYRFTAKDSVSGYSETLTITVPAQAVRGDDQSSLAQAWRKVGGAGSSPCETPDARPRSGAFWMAAISVVKETPGFDPPLNWVWGVGPVLLAERPADVVPFDVFMGLGIATAAGGPSCVFTVQQLAHRWGSSSAWGPIPVSFLATNWITPKTPAGDNRILSNAGARVVPPFGAEVSVKGKTVDALGGGTAVALPASVG